MTTNMRSTMQTSLIIAVAAAALFGIHRWARRATARPDAGLAKEARRQADEFARSEQVRRRSASRLSPPPSVLRPWGGWFA